MQLLLPLFTKKVKLITPTLGVFCKDEIATYLHCGVPIYCHAKEDLKSFRFITSKYILQGLCKKIEISKTFGVSYDSVKRHAKKLAEIGDKKFFASDNRKGSCYKLTPEVLSRMQSYLDEGENNIEISKLEGVTEGAVRYAIRTGKLRKKDEITQKSNISSEGSNRTERSELDKSCASVLGIGTTRLSDRVYASLGALQEAEPVFEHCNNVCNAGVLFLLPALIAQGLLKGVEIYQKLEKGYYGLVTTLLFLAFMALSWIKSPEQLKQCKPGELGKILGLDRAPETKCLRGKIRQIVTQGKAQEYNSTLASYWLPKEGALYFYIDGHVQVYHGDKWNLPKKYKARERLCLPGTSEYWVNDELGMPYLVVTGSLNEKLKVAIKDQIVPLLLEVTRDKIDEDELAKDPNRSRFIIVFDREAYEPGFFQYLWDEYRISVITYRKNVKDKWEEDDFSEYETEVIGKNVKMALAEKSVTLSGVALREVRKKSESGHQTSIITTDRKLSNEVIGGKMFSRWSQENFFRYMVQDYEIDKMVEYGIEALYPDIKVVNPCYKKLSSEIKKLKEKQSRLKAKFYQIVDENLDDSIDELKGKLQEESELHERIQSYQTEIDEKLEERKKTSYYIKLKEMPTETRYNKLKTESKLFMNTIKMIAYRAETAIFNLLLPYYKRESKDGRMLVKEIIQSDADLIPDYEKKTLTVRLHSLSIPRANQAALNLCDILNETETIYPDTNLKLVYKMV